MEKKYLSETEFEELKNGIICIEAKWSGPAIVNLKETIELLKNYNQIENLFLMNIDVLSSENSFERFGFLPQGWAEIIIKKNSKIESIFKSKKPYLELENFFKQ